MNVQAGDLAILIRSAAGNEGAVFRILEWHPDQKKLLPNGSIVIGVWLIDRSLMGHNGGMTQHVRDENVRPIRDNPGTDETIQWAGKPNEVTV